MTRIPHAILGAILWALATGLALGADGPTAGGKLATERVGVSAIGRSQSFDATVQAVRQSVVASQVQAQIVALTIKAGDRVAAGAVLATLDSRIAQQQSAAARASLSASQAELTVARADLDRTRLLVDKNFISRAALDQSQARYSAALANAEAAARQAEASGVQAGLHRLTAPFSGRIAAVTAEVGEIAQPGRPLATLYDPSALRVVADVPEPLGRRVTADTRARVLLPVAGGPDRELVPVRVTPLPAIDPQTRTMAIRLDLPGNADDLVPGQYARIVLEIAPDAIGTTGAGADTAPAPRLSVPRSALAVRGEMRGVYVVGADGTPRLRQVRPGRELGADRIEILAGLSPGETVAVDANAAARWGARP
jgi:RND family efflux transporter MFP subunit